MARKNHGILLGWTIVFVVVMAVLVFVAYNAVDWILDINYGR